MNLRNVRLHLFALLALTFPVFGIAEDDEPIDPAQEQEEIANEEQQEAPPPPPATKGRVKRMEPWESPISAAVDIQVGLPSYDNYVFAGDTIDDQGLSVRLGMEAVPFSDFGKLGIGLAGGYVRHTFNGDTVAAIPFDLSVTYRLDFFRNQPLVPYGGVGIDFAISKRRDAAGKIIDGTDVYRGKHFKAGVELLLDLLEPSAVRRADSEFGLNHMYVTFEYFKSSYSSGDPNCARDELRGGIRFEF